MAEFNEYSLHAVFDKLSNENKNIVLQDDFSIDLLYYVHCVKSVPIRSFSGPYFAAFGLNMER